jgi:hypothetical protein
MHAAEQDGLLSLTITISESDLDELEDKLGRCWESSDSEPNPEEWNTLRHEIVQKAVNNILVPEAEGGRHRFRKMPKGAGKRKSV